MWMSGTLQQASGKGASTVPCYMGRCWRANSETCQFSPVKELQIMIVVMIYGSSNSLLNGCIFRIIRTCSFQQSWSVPLRSPLQILVFFRSAGWGSSQRWCQQGQECSLVDGRREVHSRRLSVYVWTCWARVRTAAAAATDNEDQRTLSVKWGSSVGYNSLVLLSVLPWNSYGTLLFPFPPPRRTKLLSPSTTSRSSTPTVHILYVVYFCSIH